MDILSQKTFVLPTALEGKKAVLWAMAQVTHNDSQQYFNLLQESVKHVTEKVLDDAQLTPYEQEFICTLFHNPWWGGEEYGFNESAHFINKNAPNEESISVEKQKNILDSMQVNAVMMAKNYLLGSNELIAANRQLFQCSILVKEVTNALKNYILEQYIQKRPYIKISTKDPMFLKSKYAANIESARRERDDLGYIFVDGTMMLEQKNPELRNFEDRFTLSAMTTKMGPKFNTRWRVEGQFAYQPFTESKMLFGLPLSSTKTLKISPGLGHALQIFELAKPFKYFADWAEVYAA